MFLVVFAAAALLVLGPITFETCMCRVSLFVTGEEGFAEKEVQVEAHILVIGRTRFVSGLILLLTLLSERRTFRGDHSRGWGLRVVLRLVEGVRSKG